MEKFIFTDLKTTNKKIEVAIEFFVAAFVSVSLVISFSSVFDITYSVENAFSGGISSGLVCLWNNVVQTLAISDYVLLPKLEGASKECGLILTICIASLIVFYMAIIRLKRKALLLVFPVMLLAIIPVFKLEIDFLSVIFLIASISLAYLYLITAPRCTWANMITVVLVAVLTIGVFNIPIISGFAENPKGLSAVRERVAMVDNLVYGENPLQSGNLQQRERESSSKTALEITMQEPHSMYLRGFAGERYDGLKWENLSNSSHYGFADTAYWIEKDGFDIEGQGAEVRNLVSEDQNKAADVNIKAVKADKRYAYIPYEISGEIENSRSFSGSYVAAGKFGRLKNYSYKAYDNSVKEWTDTAGKLIMNQDEKEIHNYLVAESYYNSFVYGNYTFVSAKDRQLLGKYFGPSKATIKAHADYKVAIKDIKNYLNDNFIYTDVLGKKNDENQSMLEAFFKEKKGYDVQFATAATILFRYYGIPARYVEGFLLTPEDAKKMEAGKPYEVSMEKAHAWPEIYVDGIGFVPIEVSSKFEGIMEEADLSIGISNSLYHANNEQSGSGENETVEAGGADKQHKKIDVFMIALIIFLLFVVIALALFIGKLIGSVIGEYSRKRKLCYKTEPKVAVGAILGFMEEDKLPISQSARNLGNRAAYSRETIDENMRQEMLLIMKNAKKEKKKIEKVERKKLKANKRNARANGHGFGALFMWGKKSRE